MSFLTGADLYRKQFSAAPFVCGDFRVRPLRQKSMTYHHFWKYYTTSFDKFDPWRQIAPFVCEPTGRQLSATPPDKGIRAFARPATYLFPFGWSNTIEMSLHGKMSPATLQDYVAQIRKSNDGPFQMQGKNMGLSEVFKAYSDRLKKACFVREAGAPDFRRVDRHMIVCVTHFAGPKALYKAWGGAGPTIPVADKAQLHSALLGETVPMDHVAAADAGDNGVKDYLITRYRDTGFAISYFDKGTLLFPQDAATEAKNSRSLGCLSSNVLHFMMMTRGLLSFYNWSEAHAADEKSLVGQVRDLAKQHLLAIPDRYTNPVCKTWFQFYAPWKNLAADEQESKDKPKDK
jgi:hypothetical protein